MAGLVSRLFVLLQHYGGLGASARGDTAQLVQVLFKVIPSFRLLSIARQESWDGQALTLLIREATFFALSEAQVHILLHYADADVADHDKQATAFPLLKALLSRAGLSQWPFLVQDVIGADCREAGDERADPRDCPQGR